MKMSQIAVDVEKEEQGDWVALPDLPGVSVKVRSINTLDYRQRMSDLNAQTLRRKAGRARGADGLSIEEFERNVSQCTLEKLLLDWKGLEDESGEPVAYVPETARELLFEPKYRVFRNAVVLAAGIVGEAVAEAEEELEKN